MAKTKPKKPYRTYPLTAHPNGQWCKKVRGKVHFFGTWAGSKTALEEYNRQAADLHAGRITRTVKTGASTIKSLGNAYLATQEQKARRGLITAAWFNDCLAGVKGFAAAAGKQRPWDDLRAEDFGKYRMKLYDRFGVCAIDRHITIIRAMFKHAYETDLIGHPVKYGGRFDKPSAKERRQNRLQKDRANGKRLFSASEIRKLIKAANEPLRTIILLGINGGFGNTDCATLPINAINFRKRIIDYERPKTAVQRVVPTWPETLDGLREVLRGDRPEPSKPEYAELAFLTVFGNPWKKESVWGDENQKAKVRRHYAIVLEFGKLIKRLKMEQQGRGFYGLRHTFRTLADETRDQHAVHRIMGHSLPGMSGIYVEEISVARLRAVVNHVRSKIFPSR